MIIQILLEIAGFAYIAASAFVLLYVLAYTVLLLIYVTHRRADPPPPTVPPEGWPSVTIQLPIYNEAHVVERLLHACAALDYPPDKLHIQILDDSTDHTTDLIADVLADLRRYNVRRDNIHHIRRAERTGYKAGALAYGLRDVTTDCVAIFDADFVPAPDFLRRTLPYFSADRHLAMVQTRWSHLNHDTNWLTRAQSLNIDAHFAVEQVARNRGGLPMSMNGTGAVWRVSAINAAGGWSALTLTEDLDLSYRALLRGWRFLYLRDVAVPGELPPQVQAYKTQQARWATGSTQCLRRHLHDLLTSPRHNALQKFMGLTHLGQYLIQPVLLCLFLLAPPLLLGGFFQRLPAPGILSLFGIIPPLLIACGQAALYDDWPRRLLYFPAQLLVGVAVVLSNSVAVLRVFLPAQQTDEFKRTPKFRVTAHRENWTTSHYRLTMDGVTFFEGLLTVYALGGVWIALAHLPAFAPYMLTYAVAFGVFAAWNLYQTAH
ncbi:MAG: glycosyltransferase [Anaerolineaceae bacterium]|nr:MAG: glycosyltransferase [Anaerolineaceae bacterium]